VGPAGHTPLAGRPGPGVFPKIVLIMCQSQSVRGVSNVRKAVEQLIVAARPSFMAGWPDKWASRVRPEHRLTPPINTPVLPLTESVKKVRFNPL
jgi:hypothetical protein